MRFSVAISVAILVTVQARDPASKTPVEPHALWLAHNVVRKAAGLPALVPSDRLTRAAQGHADWMLRTRRCEHDEDPGPTQTHTMRLAVQKYRYRWAAENIAFRYGTVEALMSPEIGWMGSRPHRQTILSREATEVGFGVAGPYVAAVFATSQ